MKLELVCIIALFFFFFCHKSKVISNLIILTFQFSVPFWEQLTKEYEAMGPPTGFQGIKFMLNNITSYNFVATRSLFIRFCRSHFMAIPSCNPCWDVLQCSGTNTIINIHAMFSSLTEYLLNTPTL